MPTVGDQWHSDDATCDDPLALGLADWIEAVPRSRQRQAAQVRTDSVASILPRTGELLGATIRRNFKKSYLAF